MAVLVDQFDQELGSVKGWLRADQITPIPARWLICDGSVIVDADSPWDGLTLPDLRDTFLKGHPTLTNANFAADTDYRINVGGAIPTGGTASLNLAHTHGLGSHTHGMAAHTHPISNSGTHTHGLSGHTHSIPSDGSHSHTITVSPDPGTFLETNLSASYPGNDGLNGRHTHNASSNSTGSHNHGGTASGGNGSSNAGGDHNHGAATGAGTGTTDPSAGLTDSGLTAVDPSPPWFGMLLLVKVR